MSSRTYCSRRLLPGFANALAFALCSLLLAVMLGLGSVPNLNAQDNSSDPSEMFLKAFTSVQQADKMESEGRLKAALQKYRFAASLLDQLGKTNPNWQPLIVQYRVRKTTENIQKLDEKIRVQGSSAEPLFDGGPVVNTNPGSRPLPGNNSTEDDPLPAADDGSGAAYQGSSRSGRSPGNSMSGPSGESFDRAAQDLKTKLDKTQIQLNDALNQLNAAQKDKKQAQHEKSDVEFQLNSLKSKTASAQKKLEIIKADRDDLQNKIDKAEAGLKDVQGKGAKATDSRKELVQQINDLKKALAKAQEVSDAAAKNKDDLEKKVAAGEKGAEGGDSAAAGGEAAAKIQGLEAANAILTQKLSAAESTIADLHTESAKKKEELDGVRKELGSLKDQLTSSRDQNDRSATTITDLRKQLDENAEQLTQLRNKGITNEDSQRLTKENELLRGIVLRQLKDQARRDAARELLKTELARLEVQSKTLDEQVEVLGRPTVQLTDEERALFKEPQISISDNSTDSGGMAASITAVRAKPGGAGTEPATPPTVGPEAGVAGSNTADTLSTSSPGSAPGAPVVGTAPKPPVAGGLVPMALEAMDSFNRGKYPEAEKKYEVLLAREPKNSYLLGNQGVVLFRQDKLKSAEVMLRRATTISPKDAFSQSILGIVYYKMHRYDEAIGSLTQAIQLDPKNATAHNYLGITSSQKGWPEAAIDELQKALALNPNYADAHFNIAVIYATNQPPAKDRAEEHYKIATSLGAAPDPVLEKLIKN